MELRHGTLPRHLPPHIAGELHTSRFCKLEYPIMHPSAKPNDIVTLNIWCTTEKLRRPVGAERVARIIGPAIAGWMEVGHLAPIEVPTVSTASLPAATTVQPAQPERERPRRGGRVVHSGDGERVPVAMVAKPNVRGDEMRS
jgi:hypothetical protein